MDDRGAFAAYGAALRARGLPDRDVRVLVASVRRWRAPFGVEQSLLPFVHERLYLDERTPLLDAVAEAQARGPRVGPWADGWRALYTAGCPLDHIWAVLWHAFRDPSGDPQDERWLGANAGLANVHRYVTLGFPRSGAPDTYGPGLGCEQLVRNARLGTLELLRLGVEGFLVGQGIERCRAVLSPGLCAMLDARASASADDNPIPWLDALDRAIASREAVHDVGGDRYRLATEPGTPAIPRRRRAPAPPGDVDPDLPRLLRRWRRRRPWNTTTVADLQHTDPLAWLQLAAEMAVYQGLDVASGRVRFREPLTPCRG